MNLLFCLSLAIIVFCMGGIIYLVTTYQSEKTAERLSTLVKEEAEVTITSGSKLRTSLTSFSRKIRSSSQSEEDTAIRNRLRQAGFGQSDSVDLYIGIRILSPLSGIVIGSFISENTAFWIFALLGLFYLLPDMVLRVLIARRKKKIRRALPTALDLLVICVDAGLGLDQALARVIQEIGLSSPELKQELYRMQQEQRVGRTRAESWEALANRTEIEELKSFVSLVLQTERFGTPISKALTLFSADLRDRRRVHAEEAAEKSRIKIVFPLVFFIFPCLFVVLLTPALIDLFRELRGLGQ